MRWPALVILTTLAACGGGGGGSVVVAVEQSVSFGIVRPDMPTSLQLQVPNPIASTATAEIAGGNLGAFAVEPGSLPTTVTNGGNVIVRIVVTPQGAGDLAGELRLRFRGGGEQKDIVLKLAAFVETPRVALRETTVDFGEVYIGRPETLRAYVENRSVATPVAVTSMDALPPGYSGFLPARTLAPGEFVAIAITRDPVSVRIDDFEVKIHHDAGDPLALRILARTDPIVDEVTVDFGNVPLTDGKTDWLTVDLEFPAVSLSLEAIGEDAAASPQLIDLEGPGGYVYLDESATGPLRWKAYGSEVFAITIPNSDRAAVQLIEGGGRYRFRFSADGTTLAVRATVESRVGGIVDGGVLDMNIFFAPALGLNPAQDQKLADVLAGADAVLQQVGLRIGDVSYSVLSNADYDIITTMDEFNGMLKESASASEPRLNLFFVSSLFPAWYGSLAGAAADVPVPKRNGTIESGIVVDFTLDTEFLKLVVAHEAGHALGLLHTTESDGTFDDIEDTLPCPPTSADSICPEIGASNLMHWYWAGGEKALITPGQGRIILGHPLVAPLPAGLAALAQKAAPELRWLAPQPGFCGTCAR